MLDAVESWMIGIYEWATLVGLALLAIELLRDLSTGRLTKLRGLDTLASLSTQIPFYVAEALSFTLLVMIYYGVSASVAPFHLPIDGWTIALAILGADLAYYWEHRASHRIRLLWLSHAVHHSSPIMNTAVAFRFGLLDPLIPIPFHLPLILVGFDPLLVILGEVVVLSYQTWLHSELFGRLPPLDAVLNTPSNHRVHHGTEPKYLDKNYGGILILWDRLFGTYQREEETPTYGLVRQIDTVNPIKVWFSEVPDLVRDLAAARGVGEVWQTLSRPPGWKAERVTDSV